MNAAVILKKIKKTTRHWKYRMPARREIHIEIRIAEKTDVHMKIMQILDGFPHPSSPLPFVPLPSPSLLFPFEIGSHYEAWVAFTS
jgi:hypothetical protein